MKIFDFRLNKCPGRWRSGLVLGVLFLILCLVGCVKQIHFSSGDAPADAAEISVALQPGETALLDGFTGLHAADFSGSSDLAEVTAWASAHPEIDVTYTVPFPCDILAESASTSLDLSALSSAELTDETISLFSYLPELQDLTLDGSKVTVQDVLRLHNQFPSLKINCILSVGSCRLDLNAAALNLTSITHSDVAEICSLLPLLTQCKTIDLGSRSVEETADTITWEDILFLEQAAPDIVFDYVFTLYDKGFTLNSAEMDLNHITIDDQGDLVRRVVRCMPSLTLLDMDFCGVDDEHMAAIRDEFPSVKVVWRIWFGRLYSCRTDVEKILASDAYSVGFLTDDNCQSLKYCTDVKYLDIGHNEPLTDISFIRYMPKLEVAIFSYCNLSDISAVADCPNFEFLEFVCCNVTDLSPLAGLTGLHHLNFGRNFNITDITPLYNLTELERLWIGCEITGIPQEQIDTLQSIVPNCVINTSNYEPLDGWRYGTERYELLTQQFGYNTGDFTTIWNDPKYFTEDQPHVWW